MVDNYFINQAESGTLTPMASDEVGGVKYPRTKAGWGSAGVYNDPSLTAPYPVQLVPYATGGLSRRRVIAAASTNATSVKSTAGQLYAAHAFNASGATKYLKLYDKTSAPVVGTDVPVETYPLPAGEMTPIQFGGQGVVFASGIALALTGALADSDTTALTANDVILNLHYK